uniref:IP07226p n=1 Tax=Drosophila melanogaster TaxID=7227 RepID=Q8IR81_DROME|nr:IP07226p [Drosophila melanogaster]AOQ12725.1 CG32652-PA [synthetic construct]
MRLSKMQTNDDRSAYTALIKSEQARIVEMVFNSMVPVPLDERIASFWIQMLRLQSMQAIEAYSSYTMLISHLMISWFISNANY